MDDRTDPDVLTGFVAEVANYLPTVRSAVADFAADPTRTDVPEEAARMLHCIKGAAGMLGFDVLSRMAEHLEEYVWDLAAGRFPLREAALEEYPAAVDLIAVTVAGLLTGHAGTDDDLTRIQNVVARLGDPTAPRPPSATDELLANFDGLPDVFAGAPLPIDDAFAFDLPAEPAPAEDLDAELREIFRAEAEDLFRTIHTLMPELDARRDDPARVQAVRRAVHSLKGAAGAVGLKSVSRLSHRMEDLLDRLHEAGRAVTDDEFRLLQGTTDTLEGMTEGKADEALVARLLDTYEAILAGVPDAAAEGERSGVSRTMLPASESSRTSARPEEPIPEPAAASGLAKADRRASLRVPVERLDEMIRLLVELVTTRATVEQRLVDFARFADELKGGADRLRRVAARFDQHTLRDLPTGNAPVNRIKGHLAGAYGFDALEFDRYSDAHLLARELTESAIDVQTIAAELATLFGDLDGLQNRQGRVVGELEDRLFRLRMLPLAAITDRLGRAVRGAAEAIGKQATFQVSGGETALDKTILDAMADPLGHLVRNAVAHGIETPDMRRAAGKPAAGTVALAATREGNQIVLRVTDDGAGIHADQLRATAVARGFLTTDAAATTRPEELHRLLFLPGFTTAEAVGEIAGRGVGLDAVQAQVTRLKGSLSVESTPGVGTTFTVRLPLTLAITRALMVEARQQTFALPLDAVSGIHRADGDQFGTIGGARVFREGNTVYPVVRLADALALPGDDTPTARVPVVLVRAGGKDVALVVDRLTGGREVVVKGLGSHLKAARGILGATLTGDGRVVLILNPAELATTESAAPRPAAPARMAISARRRALIVDDSASVRRVVAGMLQRAGWDVVTATDGMDALDRLAGGDRPAVILSDVEMPRMDGYELLAAVRADAVYQDIPVVMLTSRAHDKHRQKALGLGAVGYLVKPYEEAALLRTLEEAVARRAVAGTVS